MGWDKEVDGEYCYDLQTAQVYGSPKKEAWLMLIEIKSKGPKKKKKRRNCFSCIHHSRLSSDFEELPPGRIRCRYWAVIATCTHAKICRHFEPHAPHRKRKKRKGGGKVGLVERTPLQQWL